MIIMDWADVVILGIAIICMLILGVAGVCNKIKYAWKNRKEKKNEKVK